MRNSKTFIFSTMVSELQVLKTSLWTLLVFVEEQIENGECSNVLYPHIGYLS